MSNHPLMAAAVRGASTGGHVLPPQELLQQLMDNITLQQQRQVRTCMPLCAWGTRASLQQQQRLEHTCMPLCALGMRASLQQQQQQQQERLVHTCMPLCASGMRKPSHVGACTCGERGQGAHMCCCATELLLWHAQCHHVPAPHPMLPMGWPALRAGNDGGVVHEHVLPLRRAPV